LTAPRISILINNHNYARFLSQSIDSALAQTYQGVQVVVVDDASSDESAAVIGRYGDRIVPVFQQTNGGQAAAINAGFRACTGEIILLLDSDDYLYPQAVERVVSAWLPGLSKVHYVLDLVDVEGRKIDTYPPPEVLLDSGEVLPQILRTGRYQTAVTSGNAFARVALDKVMPVPPGEFRISADGYLTAVVPFHGPVAAIQEPLGAYRQHGGNAWSPSSSSATAFAERLRGSLGHDLHRYAALENEARAHGLSLSPGYSFRDHQHLETRLASLRLDPARHPYPDDSSLSLSLLGVQAVTASRLPWRRQLVLIAWFLAAGILPASLARRAVNWRLLHVSRPGWVDRSLKRLRRAMR
jgi:glycosyltransferase involved in cell wall biosynthesis